MRRLLSASFFCFLVTACASAQRKNDAQAPQSPPADMAQPATGAQAGYGGQPSQYAPPPPAPSQAASEPKAEPQAMPTTPGTSPSTPTSPQSRSFALSRASTDIEAAQRELDVAGSSCQNACRALGSMDRAAGQICLLTREDNTHDRCDDAKRRLYNARDRVRSTCGTCPDNQPATDRNAPVPSMR